jgi:hypothetical protein
MALKWAACLIQPRKLPAFLPPHATLRLTTLQTDNQDAALSYRSWYVLRSTFFCTLPIALRGRVSAKRMRFGS